MGNYGNSRRTAVRNAPTPRGPVAWESCLTLCVAVTTADGLIMGADSMTVVRDGPLSKTYANANKVLEIAGLPIAGIDLRPRGSRKALDRKPCR